MQTAMESALRMPAIHSKALSIHGRPGIAEATNSRSRMIASGCSQKNGLSHAGGYLLPTFFANAESPNC
jgi:hypothetical protein